MQIELLACHTCVSQCHSCIKVHQQTSRRICSGKCVNLSQNHGENSRRSRTSASVTSPPPRCTCVLVFIQAFVHSFKSAIIRSKLNRSCTGGKFLLLHNLRICSANACHVHDLLRESLFDTLANFGALSPLTASGDHRPWKVRCKQTPKAVMLEEKEKDQRICQYFCCRGPWRGETRLTRVTREHERGMRLQKENTNMVINVQFHCALGPLPCGSWPHITSQGSARAGLD
jgi:hypothetical protein